MAKDLQADEREKGKADSNDPYPLKAYRRKDTEDLNDTDAKYYAKCGVIALMESARDDDVGRFKENWYQINLNRGVAADVKFGEQETKLAKLYEAEEHARALAKLYEDEKQTGGPLANFMIDVKHKEKLAISWIKEEVKKIIHDVEDGGWRKKKNQSRNGGEGVENEAGCNVLSGVERKGAKDRVPDQKAKDEVGKESRHVLKVIGNALPVIYPGRTALHMAAANGNVEIVREICAVDDVDLNKRDVLGYTPLHLACYSTHPKREEVIKLLLACPHIDANVAAKAQGYYFTPLHLAIKARSTDIADMLLDWSPIGKSYSKVLDVDTKSTHGWTALHLAVRLKILEKDEGKKADFVTMITAIIRFVNAHSPEAINKSDNTKSTPLHTSVAARDHELVERLLEDGDKIDPELLDDKRRTALEIAVHQGDYPMVQKIQHYLERAGIVGNQKAYADSATAILVGAALLVTVTFAGWVQIPTNDSTLFWVFISLSFYFAVATFVAAAGAAIPSKGSTLGQIRRTVLLSAYCLAISLACAVAAFAIAGFIGVPPGIEHQRKVIATTVIGGIVCLFCLLSFVRKILTASGIIFLWLDYSAQNQFHKHISKPFADGVKKMLGDQRVTDIEKWYKERSKAWYKNHVTNFFYTKEEQQGKEGSTSSHNGSKSTTDGSTSSFGNENSSLGNKKSGGPPSDENC